MRSSLPLHVLLSIVAGLAGCEGDSSETAQDAAAPDRRHAHPLDASLLDAAAALDPHAAHAGMTPSDIDPASQAESLVARGEYLVRHVAGCMECHTPRRKTGTFDESLLLSGVENLEDLVPEDDTRGAIHSRNLTPDDETGLGRWSDEEIKTAIQHGTAPKQRVLHWTMPFWLYHEMTPRDADAVVAYLRSIPAVVHEVPERQPLPVEPRKAWHMAPEAIPTPSLPATDPDYGRALRGRYLATIGLCPYCHTAPSGDGGAPIDVAAIFMGRREVLPIRLGTPVPEQSPTILTRNLTPDPTGLEGWSESDVARTLLQGVSKSGLPVCDPMPSNFGGSFVGMLEQDALDIGFYLTGLSARDSGEIEVCCKVCHTGEEDDDAGAGGAGRF